MKTKFFLFFYAILSTFSCSKNNETDEDKTGNIEVIVLLKNSNEPIFDAEISIDILSLKKTTEVDGVVAFNNINEGSYEIISKVPFSNIIAKDNITVENNKTTYLTVYFDHPNTVSEPVLNIDEWLEYTYFSLINENIFGAYGYATIWGDIGVDIFTNNDAVSISSIQNLNVYDYDPNDKFIEEIWTNHYKVIRNINAGIEAIENSNFTTELNTDENVAIAEFKFLRALTYFNLVKLFGNPVVIKSTNFDENQPNIQSQIETYDLIVEDLIFAQNNLISSNIKSRASISAAQALLGKVYMQMAGFPLLKTEKYQNALEQFSKFESKFSLTTDYSDNFNGEITDNSEIIFKVDFKLSDDPNLKSWDWFFWGPKGDTQIDFLILTRGFIASYFEIENDFNNIQFPLKIKDKRFYENVSPFTITNEIANNSTNIEDWRPYKLSENYQKGNSFHLPILRYADILLMIAEAENAINGPTSKAYDAVNKVRRRAYGNSENDIPSNLNQEEFLNIIIAERHSELCYEGHRKDDLIRTQKLLDIIDKFNTNNINNKKNFESHEYVFPIPTLELQLNPNIIQNPGY